MVLILSAVIIVVIFGIWKIFDKYRTVWRYTEQFPGPITYPFVGNLPQIGLKPNEYLESIHKWVRKYNWRIYRIWAAGQIYLLFSHPNDVETVLSSTTLLFKTDVYTFMRPWLGEGLLTSFGSKWRKHRKMITPSFHFQILLQFIAGINGTTDTFVRRLKEKSADGGVIDIQPIVHKYTLDVICETAMGVKINSLEKDDSDILKAINTLCFVIQDRIFSPIRRFDILFRFTSLYRQQEHAIKVLKKRLTEIIEKRKKLMSSNTGNEAELGEDFKRPKMAFLDNLLTAEVDGRPLSFLEIFEEVSTFLFEGHDTTGSAICFTFYTLSRHPEVQAKVFAEQQGFFGSDINHHPTYQEIQDMKYLELVVKETLRLYPSVPLIARTNTEMIEINGQKIPPNTTLTMLLSAMGYNEDFFPEPCEFRPERFLASNREGANPFDNVPFSAGPRNCIGQKFAMMELKATMSKVVRHFEILPPIEGLSSGIYDLSLGDASARSEYDPILGALLTLKSENGILVRLKPRIY